MKVAVRYGDKITVPRIKVGTGLVGYAALHKEAVVVPDVSLDPRYIKLVADARSELVIPLLLQDRASACSISRAPSSTRSRKATPRC